MKILKLKYDIENIDTMNKLESYGFYYDASFGMSYKTTNSDKEETDITIFFSLDGEVYLSGNNIMRIPSIIYTLIEDDILEVAEEDNEN